MPLPMGEKCDIKDPMAIRRTARAVYDSKYHMAWDAEMAQRLSLMKRDAKGMPMGLNSLGVSFTNKGWQFTSIQIKVS